MKINFETLAIEEFPEIVHQKQISRKQIKLIMEKNGINRFPWHIINENNTISRGIYKFEYTPSEGIIPEEKPVEETDEELYTRIQETYTTMVTLVNAVARGVTPSLIISGAPGLGKSFITEKVLELHNRDYIFHKGYLKATHLYRLLWENKNKGQTIILDDTDSIFDELTALNILKAALELKESRLIGWGSEKEFTDESGDIIPRYFQYQGSIIFLTNISFNNSKNTKLSPHLAALESRSLQFDMNIRTPREIFCRLKQVIAEGDINRKLKLTEKNSNDILEFMQNNLNSMKEISIRSYEKLAAIVHADPLFWQVLAKKVVLR